MAFWNKNDDADNSHPGAQPVSNNYHQADDTTPQANDDFRRGGDGQGNYTAAGYPVGPSEQHDPSGPSGVSKQETEPPAGPLVGGITTSGSDTLPPSPTSSPPSFPTDTIADHSAAGRDTDSTATGGVIPGAPPAPAADPAPAYTPPGIGDHTGSHDPMADPAPVPAPTPDPSTTYTPPGISDHTGSHDPGADPAPVPTTSTQPVDPGPTYTPPGIGDHTGSHDPESTGVGPAVTNNTPPMASPIPKQEENPAYTPPGIEQHEASGHDPMADPAPVTSGPTMPADPVPPSPAPDPYTPPPAAGIDDHYNHGVGRDIGG
jgi:hypothetical protein